MYDNSFNSTNFISSPSPELEHRQPNHLLAIFIFLQIVFLILVGVVIYNFNQPKVEVPKKGISNFDAIPSGEVISYNEDTKANNSRINFNLGDDKKSVIEGELYRTIALNLPESTADYGGKIREGSARQYYFKDQDFYFVNFIVDFEDIGQSYRVIHRWTENYPNQNVPPNNGYMVFCLPKSELIYGEFNCQDQHEDYVLNMIVGQTLPYMHPLSDGYTTTIEESNPNRISINAKYRTDENTVKTVSAHVKEYLEKLGFSDEEFELYFVRESDRNYRIDPNKKNTRY